MGVPAAIIIMIALIMGMFAVAGFVIFKNREKFGKQTIDPYPHEEKKMNE